MHRQFVFLIIGVLFCNSCIPKHQHDAESHNTQEIYTLEGLEHGLIQSPVNILTAQSGAHVDHDVEIYSNETAHADTVINTGHSVKLDFESGTKIKFDGKEYAFVQAHFHTPSEHQVDGITYPMEIHFVSIADNQNDEDQPDYLVVGAFFKMGKENKFIQGFIDRIPEHENETADLKDNPVYIDDLLLPGEPFNDYYHYKGSLTTPPYTESVNWVIMKRILEASPEQIRHINKLEGNNARHVQALYGRVIENN